jgi:hypothetical protein
MAGWKLFLFVDNAAMRRNSSYARMIAENATLLMSSCMWKWDTVLVDPNGTLCSSLEMAEINFVRRNWEKMW